MVKGLSVCTKGETMKKQKFNVPELSVEELSKALYEANIKLQTYNTKILEDQKKAAEFYANISHDLRSPITAISNSIQYLISNDKIGKEERIETLELMQRRTAYLEKLINDIFLLSSLDSSENKIHKEEVDLRFFIEDCFYMCEADEKFSDCSMNLFLSEDFEANAYLDPHLMQRVFDNIFSNAVKYSKPDTRAEILVSGAIENDTAVIKIKDNGIGIAQEHLPYIFDRSYQINKARTPDSTSGSGFGLSIVKSIIEHHDGSIICSSVPGESTEFVISLPINC